jgi:WD repeat and SOF domain-containing protein 1
MQLIRFFRVFSTLYTYDTKFVLSGSDDGNLRIWKSSASAALHHQSSKELASRQYRDALRAKYASLPEVSKIERQRFMPKDIYGKGRIKRDMLDAVKRREDNRRAHQKKGEEPANPKSERRKAILREE